MKMGGITKNFTDTNVLMGAGLGVAGALAISVYGAKYLKDEKLRMILAAVAPGLAASFISKNKMTIATAVASGLAVGLLPVVGKFIMPKSPTQEGNITSGLIEDDRYSDVSGDIYADVSGFDIPDKEIA